MNTAPNPLLYFTYPLSALLTITLAIGTGVYLTRRFRLPWRLFLIGAGIFIISQVFHIPFNAGLTALFREGIFPTPPARFLPAFNALVLGLSAGLFEEVFRYLGYRWWAKDARSWARGLLYGAGHGGIEAILVGVLILIGYIVMVGLRGADLSTLVPPDQLNLLQSQSDTYWSVAWYDSILGFVERAFTLPTQIALSILVLQCYVRGRIRWLFLAIAWHALLDAVVVYTVGIWSAYLVEGMIGIFGLVSLGIIFVLRQDEPEQPGEEEEPEPQKTVELTNLPPLEETPEQLEDTRFIK